MDFSVQIAGDIIYIRALLMPAIRCLQCFPFYVLSSRLIFSVRRERWPFLYFFNKKNWSWYLFTYFGRGYQMDLWLCLGLKCKINTINWKKIKSGHMFKKNLCVTYTTEGLTCFTTAALIIIQITVTLNTNTDTHTL